MKFNRKLFKEAFKAGYKEAKKRLNESLENKKFYYVFDNDTVKQPPQKNEIVFELPFEGTYESAFSAFLEGNDEALETEPNRRKEAIEGLQQAGIDSNDNYIELPCSVQELCDEYIKVCNKALQKASGGKCPKISFCYFDEPREYNYRNDILWVRADKAIENFDVEALLLKGLNCTKEELSLAILDEMDMNWTIPDYSKAR